MKLLANIFDRIRPLFADGRRLRPMKPLFEAGENFFLSPKTCTPAAPHVRDPLDVKRYMSMVIIALLPCLLASYYFFGLRVVAMIAVSYAAGGAVEVAMAVIRKEEINEGFLVTGLLFPLILPPALPLWMVAVGVAFGVLVGKELFGGTGRNLFNPALVGRCFLALGYPKAMSSDWLTPGDGLFGRAAEYASDAVSGATPLAEAKNVPLDQWASLPDLLLGNVTGSVGETSALAIVLGGVLLVAIGVASWRTVVSMLVGFIVLTLAIHGSVEVALWHCLAGGLLFGAFFMATDPVTSPMTGGGKLVYGLLIGISTALIRNFTGYVEGVMFAILLGNMFAPLLDHIFISLHVRRLNREG